MVLLAQALCSCGTSDVAAQSARDKPLLDELSEIKLVRKSRAQAKRVYKQVQVSMPATLAAVGSTKRFMLAASCSRRDTLHAPSQHEARPVQVTTVAVDVQPGKVPPGDDGGAAPAVVPPDEVPPDEVSLGV